MEKVWFVILNNERLGPYTRSELSRQYNEKIINKLSWVFKVGYIEPSTYGDLLMDEDGVPLLPDSLSPPIDEDGNFERIPNTSASSNKKIVNKSKIIKKIFFTIFFFVAVFFVTYYILLKMNEVKRPAMMLIRDFEKLKQIQEESGVANIYQFYLARDKSKIWMGTNISSRGFVSIQMSSVDEEHLGSEPIKIHSKGHLDNFLVSFETMNFEKGDKLYDGFYDIEITSLGDLQVPLIRSFERPRSLVIKNRKRVYIGHLEIKKFRDILAAKKREKESNNTDFWEELRQKYLTIKMISMQIQSSIDDVFDNSEMNWKDKVLNFENSYKKQYGDFFTSFVIANDKSYGEIKEKDFPDKIEVISNYTSLSRIAKKIGTQTMNTLHALEVGSSQDKVLEKESKQRLRSIIDTCDRKILILDKKNSLDI